MLHSFFSSFISPKQFGFLPNRPIHDATRLAQEVIHSIKTKNRRALMLKVDFVKAYDRVNWDFLRPLLLHTGLDWQVTNWIMGCITSVNF